MVAPFDVTAQTEYIFGLIGEILTAAGMTYDDVVRAQTYLTDIADFPKFSAVRDRYFGASKPASTLLEVKGLAHDGCCVEVEVTAKVAKLGVVIYEVGISYAGRTYAEGKKIGWKDGVAALWFIFRYRFFD